MGDNATGTLGGRFPFPENLVNFSSQNGVLWCIMRVLLLRFMNAVFRSPAEGKKIKHLSKYWGGRRHRTTPAGQVLGFATPAVLNIPSALVAAQFSLSDQWRFVFRLVSRADKMSSGIVTALRLTDTCECRLVR